MLGYHFQNPVNDWPRAAEKLPDYSVIKAVDNVQLLREARSINPTFHTNLRHWTVQNLPANESDFQAHAKAFFDTFIDGTFRNYASYVSTISEYNEYFGNGQDAVERRRWIAWAEACAIVWERDFRSQPDYRHIRLVLAETAVGNDIPIEVASYAHRYDCLLGYHPYVPMWQGQIMPSGVVVINGENRIIDEWKYYSGRWAEMDKRYKAAGYTVDWFMGEAGPVKDASGTEWKGVLAPNSGWRGSDVCNGDVDCYLKAIEYWCERAAAWNRVNDNRCVGGVLFTSGGGSTWEQFETKQPEMDAISELVSNYPPQQPPIEPPEPEPIPPAEINHTVHLLPQDTTQEELDAVTEYLHPTRSGFTYSADFAHAVMWHDPAKEFVYIWDGDRWNGDIFAWFADRGIGTIARSFSELHPPAEMEIIDIVDDLPTHTSLTYGKRALSEIDTIVVHHSAGSTSIEGIANYHINGEGWPGIAYHYCIQTNGDIYQVNRLETRSYHVGHHNTHVMGICLLGNFQDEPPNDDMLSSLDWLINYLQNGELSHVENVKPHRFYSQTACPGNTIDEWWKW